MQITKQKLSLPKLNHMINYENEIMDLIPGETPKQKYDNIRIYLSGELTNSYIRIGMDRYPLPINTEVEFTTGTKGYNVTTCKVNGRDEVEIYLDSRMGHKAIIVPHSSNVFFIRFLNQ